MSAQQSSKGGSGQSPQFGQAPMQFGAPQSFGMNPSMPFGGGYPGYAGTTNRNFQTTAPAQTQAPQQAPMQSNGSDIFGRNPAIPQGQNPWSFTSDTQPGPNYQFNQMSGQWVLPGGYGPSPYGAVNGYGAPLSQGQGVGVLPGLQALWPQYGFGGGASVSGQPVGMSGPVSMAGGNPAAVSKPFSFGF